MQILQKLQPCYLGCLPHPERVPRSLGHSRSPQQERLASPACFCLLGWAHQALLRVTIPVPVQSRTHTVRALPSSSFTEKCSRSLSENRDAPQILLLLNRKTVRWQVQHPPHTHTHTTAGLSQESVEGKQSSHKMVTGKEPRNKTRYR